MDENAPSKLKTPISYYGGKQVMAKHILPLIPPHTQYVEPFFGGGALFFKKDRSKVEVINDLNKDAINFYEVLKNDYDHLNILVQATLHSEAQHRSAAAILKSAKSPCPIRRAWAFWMQCNMSFGSAIFSGFAHDNSGSSTKRLQGKKALFGQELAERLENTQIFCRDALNLIELKDREGTFFYLDPPYYNSNCGHYKGYSERDFIALLSLLATIKGKFLLSSYPSAVLTEYVKKCGWKTIEFEKPLAVTHQNKGKRKVECITMNY